MRWRLAWVCALSSVGLLGCPHTFRKGGAIDVAAYRDAQQRIDSPKKQPLTKSECPPDEVLEQLCEYPEDDICPKECLSE